MKKETAVEWLIEQLPLGIRMNLAENGIDLNQAKQIEKQQIVDAIKFFKERPYNEETPEQYYNETYGQNRD